MEIFCGLPPRFSKAQRVGSNCCLGVKMHPPLDRLKTAGAQTILETLNAARLMAELPLQKADLSRHTNEPVFGNPQGKRFVSG